MIVNEGISPKIINYSKSRDTNLKKFSFIPSKEDPNDFTCFVPVAICLITSSTFIDVFREILENLYSFLLDINLSDRIPCSQLISSVEFMRTCCFLLNDTIVPPFNTLFSLKIGGSSVQIPVEPSSGLPHIEKCIAVLIDLIDIGNIIKVWECLTLNLNVFLMSCNEYLLYLILQAFKELLFPLRWSLYVVPVLGPKLMNYLAAPVPIIIGVNSTLITVQQALAENPNASILDIDSNTLYSNTESQLCNCAKASLSKKLQLVKTYYYVDQQRFRSYKMTNLELHIDDLEFVNSVKSLPLRTSEDKEKAFISLIKHIFLEFFIQGLGNFEKFFEEETFSDHSEFNSNEFLKYVKKCENCKMEKYWKSFVESSTFQQFLDFRGKYDDSYYKRFREIINARAQGEYQIYNNDDFCKFELKRAIAPRKLMKLLKVDQQSKPKSFENDSGTILRIEIVKELRQFKEYYRLAESMNNYKLRKHSFSIGFETNQTGSAQLFYNKKGIIRLTSVLLSTVNPNNFHLFTNVNETIFPSLTSLYTEDPLSDYIIIKLFYLIKIDPKLWDFKQILQVFQFFKDFRPEIENFLQLFSGIISKMLNINMEFAKDLEEIGGKIKFITKAVKGEIQSPITRVKSEFLDEKPQVNRKLNRTKTAIEEKSSETQTRRKYKKNATQEYQKVKTLLK